MSSYWPRGLSLSDTQSPREILTVAQEEWRTSSNGIMELVLQDATSRSGNSMTIVHAKHVASNRTSKLLSVVHRPSKPYPVTIDVEADDLPDFLKKTYTRRTGLGLFDPESLTEKTETVSNDWVADTPSEFRSKLAEALNLGSVKSTILNLASSTSSVSESVPDEIDEVSQENSREDAT